MTIGCYAIAFLLVVGVACFNLPGRYFGRLDGFQGLIGLYAFLVALLTGVCLLMALAVSACAPIPVSHADPLDRCPGGWPDPKMEFGCAFPDSLSKKP